MRDETYWRWSKHYTPPKFRGTLRKVTEQLNGDAKALEAYAERKAQLPTVRLRKKERGTLGEMLREVMDTRE